MSRHRSVRNLDYYEELDDFDGEEEDEAQDMTREQEAQMKEALTSVRAVLGNDIPGLTDKEIQSHLWYYYFDVAQTVSYILKIYGAHLPKATNTKKKQKEKTSKGSWAGQGLFGLNIENMEKTNNMSLLYRNPEPQSIPAGFFDDAPWGRIPEDRRAILVGPAQFKGGLLGGKMSKLAALAKARKAAAEAKEQNGPVVLDPKRSISLLSRLGAKDAVEKVSSCSPEAPISPKPAPATVPHSPAPVIASPQVSLTPLPAPQEAGQEVKLKTPSIPPESPDQSKRKEPDVLSEPNVTDIFTPIRAIPSPFAVSMFGERMVPNGFPANERLPYFTGLPAGPIAVVNDAFAGPSPDDVVLAAQSRSKGLATKPATEAKKPTSENLEQNMKSLNISSGSSAASLTADLERVAKSRRNLDVLDEYKKSKAKENINFVVIGHVDAGKSTLMGRILYDMGVVDERTIQRYKQEAEKIGKSSFALAWVLDETHEERSRGITMDIAVNKFETEKSQFTILDAPGHKDFVPNMIAGASQADFAVLVVDSSTGAFESGFHLKGQTKEHTLLVRSLGVQRVIVAVNKLDAVSWSYERYEEIQQQMAQFLTTAGFQSKNVSFIPCSGLSGENIARKSGARVIPWYKGRTLIEELENSKPLTRAIEKPLRLTIADVFKGGFTNPVSISGRIDCGSLQVGEVLVSMPVGEKAAVKGIEVDDVPADWAVAGHNVVLHLSGIDMIHLKPGDILCDPNHIIPTVSQFNMKILAFETITPMTVDVHRGRLNVAGKVCQLIATFDKSNGTEIKKKPRIIQAGMLALINVEIVGGTIPVEPSTRIVLRANGETVAAGLVE